MTTGTLWRTTTSMSCSRRSLLLCTIWLIAYGAALRSGCALSCAASASLISCSHSSSCDAGRAFSAGIDPTTPALHCSITSLGVLTMNIGEAMTGSGRFRRTGGNLDIRSPVGWGDEGTPAVREALGFGYASPPAYESQ